MTRLGYQIPNFDYPGVGDRELFATVAAQARAAAHQDFSTHIGTASVGAVSSRTMWPVPSRSIR